MENSGRIHRSCRIALFWGEEIRYTPGLAMQLRNENEMLNLQKIWIEKPGLLLHTNVERLYADWRRGEWNVRLGQRINWGITTT
ncbi:MAG: hypothetical protein IPP72_15825 [Chitinophagaceae bacterium]|nr:hypothetical protein [Chitinophagaceae bacterium]